MERERVEALLLENSVVLGRSVKSLHSLHTPYTLLSHAI